MQLLIHVPPVISRQNFLTFAGSFGNGGCGPMGDRKNGRHATFSGMVVTSVALLLLASLSAWAEPQDKKQVDTSLESSSAQDRQGHREYEDKATGDWCGERLRLKEAGLSIDAVLVLEGFKNFRGGISTHPPEGASTLDLSLTLDTEKLFSWKEGKFYADFEGHGGSNPSKRLVGDLQIFDNLNAVSYFQLYEFWFQQKLFDGKLRLKIGKVDANTEFSVIDNGLDFLNSSSQVTPTVFVLPTTPAPMPSVNLFFTPNENFYASFGAYYSNRSVNFGNFAGNPQDIQPSDNGVFLIGETGLQWRHAPVLKNDGNLKLGAWGHTGTFTRFDGSERKGIRGFYAVLDQTLWQPEGEQQGRGLRTFLEYGLTQQSVNAIYQHTGGGLAWTGLFACRPLDVVGLSPQYAFISSQANLPRPFELALETFYQLQVTSWATLLTDLQYIINPGGQYPDALVGTLRWTMDF
jgi:porin